MWQARSFTYDSFSRLATASNPETGLIQYNYDGNGNVVTKTDPRGTTTYAYDELNRLLWKKYSDASFPRACYAYDGIDGWGDTMTNPVGHLTSSWAVLKDGGLSGALGVVAGNESYQWDAMGRPLSGKQCTPATCGGSSYPVNVLYNLLGNETSLSDSSVSRSSAYDTADRLQAFTGTLPGMGAKSLLTVSDFYPVGMHHAALGNGLTETREYNNRTWLQSLTVSNSAYSLGLTYEGNGNASTATDSVNGSWTYTYDNVNRLLTAVWPTQSSFSYSYGPNNGVFGNMSCQQNVPGGQPCYAFSFDAATNRLSGYNYDLVGNLLSDGTHSFAYDGENRVTCVMDAYGQCSQNAMQYLYDAQGQRVGRQQGNTVEDYVYDPQGHLISVHDAGGNLLRAELYTGDRHVATWNGNGLFWNHADWLGTERARTNSSGVTVEQCMDSPFGMNLNCTSTDQSPVHLAGMQYDPETGQFHTLNRQYETGFGRWLTPDPAGKKAVKLDDPQTWNMYAYVRNNPATLTDPTGLYELNDSGCGNNLKCQKKWDKSAIKFENRRLKDLRSKKDDVREAAAAFGAKGEKNGVHVGFADLARQGISGKVDPFSSTPGNPNIQMTLDFGRAGSAETQTHEGTHVAEDLVFLNSYSSDSRTYDENLSFTYAETEFDAYRAGAYVNHEHGFGPTDTQKIWDYIRAHYDPRILPKPVFDPMDFPTGPID